MILICSTSVMKELIAYEDMTWCHVTIWRRLIKRHGLASMDRVASVKGKSEAHV
jgi:hypothetical protein